MCGHPWRQPAGPGLSVGGLRHPACRAGGLRSGAGLGAATQACLSTAFSANGKDVIVDFPQQSHWTGLLSEMELVPSVHPGVT